MKDLEGKVAIVTGGATLIGAGVVRALRGYGVRVAVLDVDGAGGEKVAAADPQGCRAWQVDITDDARLEQCVAEAARHFGRLDFLVNLAATYLDDGAASGRADWLRALDINLVSAVMAARAPPLVASGGGAIVNFTSISAKAAQTGRWLYPVSKAALVQLTRNMAMDFAGDRIRVNSVSPGWTWSRVMDEITGGDRAKTDRVAADYHLLGRVGDPREVADVVAFLLSGRVLRHRRRLRGRRRLFGHGSRAGQARHSAPGRVRPAPSFAAIRTFHSGELDDSNRNRGRRPGGHAAGPGPAGQRL